MEKAAYAAFLLFGNVLEYTLGWPGKEMAQVTIA
mgnify:CR=1 FL=1